MELVYLWVEEYKNIHRQGFNFFPRFRCEYDPDTNKLTIDENDDYVDIFPDNINVTAIVGKNGSGKSSVLEVLESLDKDQNIIYFFYNGNDKLCYKSHKKIKIISQIDYISFNEAFAKAYNSNSTNICSNKSSFKKIKLNNGINNYIIQTSLIDIYKKYSDKLPKDNELYNKFDYVELYINKIGSKLSNIGLLRDYERKIERNSIPNCNKIEVENYKTIQIILKDIELIDKNLLKISEWSFEDIVIFNFIYMSLSLLNYIDYIDDIKKILISYKNYTKDKNIKNMITNINNFLKDNKRIKKLKQNLTYLIGQKTKFSKTVNRQTDRVFAYVYKCKILDFDIELSQLFKHQSSIEIKLLNSKDNYSFNDLSDGEKVFLDIARNIVDIEENTIILADEIEVFLHPLWKQKLISFMLSNFKNSLIFTTHSPFLLSDIPKQNIIFLDTYKKEDEEVKSGKQKVGNCKVVDGLNEKKETFGANIHTLLSDSFFMDGGLMGEFAKGKIESIKKFYNKVIKYKDNDKVKKDYKCFYEKKQKEFWDIQSIIGEPFLQKIVKNQLEEIELILFGKNDAIDKEIARLQALKESFNND